jgi:ubiquinone/menaquinone biosynthesis C-methylase UbiE
MIVNSEDSSGPFQPKYSGGYEIYRKSVLRHYDWLVHGVSNALVWRVPTRKIHRLYQQNLSDSHLEIGVGTGKFLVKHGSKDSNSRLVIADASHDCLEWTSERLQKKQIPLDAIVQVNFGSAQSIEIDLGRRFQSVGLNYVLHCLPGIQAKQRALEFIKFHLMPEGVLFGTTLIGVPPSHYLPARWLEKKYQKLGVFSNQEDSICSIAQLLAEHFDEVSCVPRGRAIFFRTSQPRV